MTLGLVFISQLEVQTMESFTQKTWKKWWVEHGPCCGKEQNGELHELEVFSHSFELTVILILHIFQIPTERIDSHLAPEQGSLRCEKAGLCKYATAFGFCSCVCGGIVSTLISSS